MTAVDEDEYDDDDAAADEDDDDDADEDEDEDDDDNNGNGADEGSGSVCLRFTGPLSASSFTSMPYRPSPFFRLLDSLRCKCDGEIDRGGRMPIKALFKFWNELA